MAVKDEPLYMLWGSMRRRCTDERHISYRYYGAKGIKVCARWSSFELFKADMGPRPEGTSLDRRDSTGDYEPGNCRWATITEQNSNKGDTILVTMNGVTKPVAAWARESGISPQAAHHRIRKLGMTPEEALSFPASRATRHLPVWEKFK